MRAPTFTSEGTSQGSADISTSTIVGSAIARFEMTRSSSWAGIQRSASAPGTPKGRSTATTNLVQFLKAGTQSTAEGIRNQAVGSVNAAAGRPQLVQSFHAPLPVTAHAASPSSAPRHAPTIRPSMPTAAMRATLSQRAFRNEPLALPTEPVALNWTPTHQNHTPVLATTYGATPPTFAFGSGGCVPRPLKQVAVNRIGPAEQSKSMEASSVPCESCAVTVTTSAADASQTGEVENAGLTAKSKDENMSSPQQWEAGFHTFSPSRFADQSEDTQLLQFSPESNGTTSDLIRDIDSLRLVTTRHEEQLYKLAAEVAGLARSLGEGCIQAAAASNAETTRSERGLSAKLDALSGRLDAESHDLHRKLATLGDRCDELARTTKDGQSACAGMRESTLEFRQQMANHAASIEDFAGRIDTANAAREEIRSTFQSGIEDIACRVDKECAAREEIRSTFQLGIEDIACRVDKECAAREESHSTLFVLLKTTTGSLESKLAQMADSFESEVNARAMHDEGRRSLISLVTDHGSLLSKLEARIQEFSAQMPLISSNALAGDVRRSSLLVLEEKLSNVLSDLATKYEAGHADLVNQVADQKVCIDRHETAISQLAPRVGQDEEPESRIHDVDLASDCGRLHADTLKVAQARSNAGFGDFRKEQQRQNCEINKDIFALRDTVERQESGVRVLERRLQQLQDSTAVFDAETKEQFVDMSAVLATHGEFLSTLEADADETRGLFLESLRGAEERQKAFADALARFPSSLELLPCKSFEGDEAGIVSDSDNGG